MQKIIFYYWKNSKIPKVPSSAPWVQPKRKTSGWSGGNFFFPGKHEPTDPECEWPSDSEDEEEELSEEVKDKAKLEDKEQDKDVKVCVLLVPQFCD